MLRRSLGGSGYEKPQSVQAIFDRHTLPLLPFWEIGIFLNLVELLPRYILQANIVMYLSLLIPLLFLPFSLLFSNV